MCGHVELALRLNIASPVILNIVSLLVVFVVIEVVFGGVIPVLIVVVAVLVPLLDVCSHGGPGGGFGDRA